MKHLFTYKGYTYCPVEDFDEDVIKIIHVVYHPNGDWCHVDYTPRNVMTYNSFTWFVDLGLPPASVFGYLRHTGAELHSLWQTAHELNAFGRQDLWAILKLACQ